jgi:quercetin dioxygenase-like cupin family protein
MYLTAFIAKKTKTMSFLQVTVTFEPNGRTNWHIHPRSSNGVPRGDGFYHEEQIAQSIKRRCKYSREEVKHWHRQVTQSKIAYCHY